MAQATVDIEAYKDSVANKGAIMIKVSEEQAFGYLLTKVAEEAMEEEYERLTKEAFVGKALKGVKEGAKAFKRVPRYIKAMTSKDPNMSTHMANPMQRLRDIGIVGGTVGLAGAGGAYALGRGTGRRKEQRMRGRYR